MYTNHTNRVNAKQFVLIYINSLTWTTIVISRWGQLPGIGRVVYSESDDLGDSSKYSKFNCASVSEPAWPSKARVPSRMNPK